MLLGTLLSISCKSPPATTPPGDAAPVSAPAAPTDAPADAPSDSEVAPEAPAPAGGALALRHPGQPRTRSNGAIVGPEASVVPAAGQFTTPCADRKPGESWESDGASCMCDPGGEVRCSRKTSLHGKLR
jgi:hypothetical protein